MSISVTPGLQPTLSETTVRPVRDGIDLRRFQPLGVVLWVSLSMPIAGCIYYLSGGATPSVPILQHFRLIGALLNETTALIVLWYVLGGQGKTWSDIGLKPVLRDVPRALALLLAVNVAALLVWFPAQYLYAVYAGHYLTPKSLTSMFGFGISFLSIAFACLNPFFEELIVRAYTMSEVMELGASRTLATVVSVVLQMSYHLYQGVANALILMVVFSVFSMYFARTRRIFPVVLVHLCLDLRFLVKGLF